MYQEGQRPTEPTSRFEESACANCHADRIEITLGKGEVIDSTFRVSPGVFRRQDLDLILADAEGPTSEKPRLRRALARAMDCATPSFHKICPASDPKFSGPAPCLQKA